MRQAFDSVQPGHRVTLSSGVRTVTERLTVEQRALERGQEYEMVKRE